MLCTDAPSGDTNRFLKSMMTQSIETRRFFMEFSVKKQRIQQPQPRCHTLLFASNDSSSKHPFAITVQGHSHLQNPARPITSNDVTSSCCFVWCIDFLKEALNPKPRTPWSCHSEESFRAHGRAADFMLHSVYGTLLGCSSAVEKQWFTSLARVATLVGHHAMQNSAMCKSDIPYKTSSSTP